MLSSIIVAMDFDSVIMCKAASAIESAAFAGAVAIARSGCYVGDLA